MVRLNSATLGCTLLLTASIAGAQNTPDLAKILERLDRLERDNRALTEEVRTLRARLDGVADTATAVPPAAPGTEAARAASDTPAAAPATLEQRLAIQEERSAEMAQTKVEASQKFPIRLTGMALFNAFLNSHQSGGFDYPGVASAPGSHHSGATLRQTIIGLEFRGPQTIWGGTVQGSVYMDFFAGNNQVLRMRTANLEVRWKTRSVAVGLEKPIFNPREPSSLARVGVSPLTAAGNLWLWLPQARVEQDFRFARSTGVRATMGVLQTSEVGPYAGSPFDGPLESTRPALEGRYEFFHNFDDERRIEIAPGFHTSRTHVAGLSVPSNLFSLDWFYNPWSRLEFTGAFYTGQNVAPLGNGYQQGFTIYGRYARAVGSTGGWAQFTLHAAKRIDLHLFSGQQDDDNHELAAGRIGKNLAYGGNLYYRLAPNVLVGLEASQVRTSIIGQGVRINNHYDLAFGYLF